jgi:hypothetical protein
MAPAEQLLSEEMTVDDLNCGKHSYCNSADNPTEHMKSEMQACDPVGANSDSPYLLRHNKEEPLPEIKTESCIINFKVQRMSHFIIHTHRAIEL